MNNSTWKESLRFSSSFQDIESVLDYNPLLHHQKNVIYLYEKTENNQVCVGYTKNNTHGTLKNINLETQESILLQIRLYRALLTSEQHAIEIVSCPPNPMIPGTIYVYNELDEDTYRYIYKFHTLGRNPEELYLRHDLWKKVKKMPHARLENSEIIRAIFQAVTKTYFAKNKFRLNEDDEKAILNYISTGTNLSKDIDASWEKLEQRMAEKKSGKILRKFSNTYYPIPSKHYNYFFNAQLNSLEKDTIMQSDSINTINLSEKSDQSWCQFQQTHQEKNQSLKAFSTIDEQKNNAGLIVNYNPVIQELQSKLSIPIPENRKQFKTIDDAELLQKFMHDPICFFLVLKGSTEVSLEQAYRLLEQIINDSELLQSFIHYSFYLNVLAIKLPSHKTDRLMEKLLNFPLSKLMHLVQYIDDLFQITTAFSGKASDSLIQKFIDTPELLNNLIKWKSDVFKMVEKFPKYSDKLMDTILGNSKIFQRLIFNKESMDFLYEVAKKFPNHSDRLMKKIVADSEMYNQLTQYYTGNYENCFYTISKIFSEESVDILMQKIFENSTGIRSWFKSSYTLYIIKDFFPKKVLEKLLQQLLKNSEEFQRLIPRGSYLSPLAEALSEHENELVKKIIEDPTEFRRIIYSANDLRDMAKTFSDKFIEKIMRKILNDTNEFHRVIDGCYTLCSIASSFPPKYADNFIEKVLNDASEFNRLIQSDDNLGMLATACSEKLLVQLIKKVSDDFEKFKPLIYSYYSSFIDLVKKYPTKFVDFIMQKTLNDSNEFHRVINSLNHLYTIANNCPKKYADTFILKILNDPSEFNRLFKNAADLRKAAEVFPRHAALLAQSSSVEEAFNKLLACKQKENQTEIEKNIMIMSELKAFSVLPTAVIAYICSMTVLNKFHTAFEREKIAYTRATFYANHKFSKKALEALVKTLPTTATLIRHHGLLNSRKYHSHNELPAPTSLAIQLYSQKK